MQTTIAHDAYEQLANDPNWMRCQGDCGLVHHLSALKEVEREDESTMECVDCRHRPICVCCKDAAEPDADGCAACELDGWLHELSKYPYDLETQGEVAKWTIRVAKKALEAA